MRKYLKRIVSCALIVAVGGSLFASAAFATSDMRGEKDDIEQQIHQNEQEQSEAEDRLAQIEAEVDALNEQIWAYDSQISDMQAQVDQLEVKMDEKQVEIDDIQADFDQQYADMKLRIQYMYENWDTQMITLFLQADGLVDFLNKAQYFGDIMQYDRDMLDKLERTRVALETAKGELKKQQDEAIATRDSMKENRQQVLALREQQDALYSEVEDQLSALVSRNEDLHGDLSDIENQIAAYEEEQRRQEEEAKRQEEENRKPVDGGGLDSNHDNYGTSSYGWCWPAPGCYGINDYFGWRTDPVGYHHGIDLQTGHGTPYVAVADGYVAFAGWSDSLGNYVCVDHGGIYTYYAHSSALYVSTGDYVTQGTVMGLTGNTGYSFGAHLHFAVYKNGDWVDPLPYLP